MQLMPSTARSLGVKDINNITENILAGTKYLKCQLNYFKRRGFRNYKELALASYNAGRGNVMKYNNTIPPFPETRHYVKKVMKYYKKYKRLS